MFFDVVHFHINEASCKAHAVSAWVHWYRNAPLTHNHCPLQEQMTADNAVERDLKIQQRVVGAVPYCQHVSPKILMNRCYKDPSTLLQIPTSEIEGRKCRRLECKETELWANYHFIPVILTQKYHSSPTGTSETLTPITHLPKTNNPFTMQKYKLPAHHSFTNKAQLLQRGDIHSDRIEVP